MALIDPKPADFSHPALRGIFSKRLVNALEKLTKTFERYHDDVDKVAAGLQGVAGPSALDELKRVPSLHVPVHKRGGGGADTVLELLGIGPDECEACGMLRSHIEEAHVVAQRAFGRSGSFGLWYRDFYTNVLRLCPNCHTALDREEIRSRPLKRILSRRTKLNVRVARLIEKDHAALEDWHQRAIQRRRDVRDAAEGR